MNSFYIMIGCFVLGALVGKFVRRRGAEDPSSGSSNYVSRATLDSIAFRLGKQGYGE